MGYGEKVPSPSGAYWRGRYKSAPGKYGTVRDGTGAVIRFDGKRKAKEAADAEEVKVRNGGWTNPASGQMTLADWADRWYAGLELAASTMANYREHLQSHILDHLGDMPLASITMADIARWEKAERKAGYRPSSVKTWRTTLHTCLADAVPDLIAVNPATKKRGRGKRTGKSRNRGPEKVITSPLGGLLIAERASILSGRDDEFVMCTLMQYTGLRLGEAVGLEAEYVRAASLRVEWQLYEMPGEMLRCAPKDDSYRNADLPPFLRDLITGHLERTAPKPCACHGKTYVFRGMGRPRGASAGGVTLRDVATIAGVSPATVSNVLNHESRLAPATRARIEEVIAKTGYVPRPAPPDPAAHWRRSSFETLFTAAASGWLPARAPLPRRPVPLTGEWPGVRLHGRNAQGRAVLRWDAVAEGLTPHGLRHAHKSWMAEQRIPEVLSEQRLGHELPGISGVYSHVTPAMRAELLAALSECWTATLDERLGMSRHSPVAALDNLLSARAESRKPALVPRDSPGDANGVLPFPVNTTLDLGRGGEI